MKRKDRKVDWLSSPWLPHHLATPIPILNFSNLLLKWFSRSLTSTHLHGFTLEPEINLGSFSFRLSPANSREKLYSNATEKKEERKKFFPFYFLFKQKGRRREGGMEISGRRWNYDNSSKCNPVTLDFSFRHYYYHHHQVHFHLVEKGKFLLSPGRAPWRNAIWENRKEWRRMGSRLGRNL